MRSSCAGSLLVQALAFALVFGWAPPVQAQEAHGASDVSSAESYAGEDAHEAELDAIGHTADGFYLDFSPMGKVELPRLFVVRRADGSLGFDAFASTSNAMSKGGYVLDPGYATASEPAADAAVLDAIEDAEHLEAEAVGPEGATELEMAEGDALSPYASNPLKVGIVPGEGEIVADLSLTRHTIFVWVAAILLLLVFLPIGAKYRGEGAARRAPKGRLQNAMEFLVSYVRDEIAKPTMGDNYPRFMPYLLTAFFFILFANLLGLIPYGATASSNINVTVVLATFTFVITQFAGTKDYWGHIFNPPAPGFVKPILIPIEFLGIFVKPIALAIRLFANLTAGHLIILSLLGLIFVFGNSFGTVAGYGSAFVAIPMTLFVYCLEILVAFIQAYVFTILSSLFIGMAAETHEHHDDHLPHDETAHERASRLANPLLHDGGAGSADLRNTVGTEAAMA
jgi:F-type H+-transporting ATPase subunit a